MSEKVIGCQGRVKVRKFRRRDLKNRLAWPPYTKPLLAHLNYSLSGIVERERWVLARVTNVGRMYFAIEDENGELIGEMSLREMDMEAKRSRLGIHFASNKVGLGYGGEAISALLDYYFNRMGFAVMYLDVAAHNTRAIRLYERMQFQYLAPFWRLEPADLKIFEDEAYAGIRRFFRRKRNSLECLFQDMQLTREHYYETLEKARRLNRYRANETPQRKDDAESLLFQEQE